MGSTSEIRTLVIYYLNGLLARRWTILITAWIICVLGWFVVAMIPNSYTSSARIYVDTQTLLRPLMKDLAVQPDIERQVDIMQRTLLTRPNIEQIVRRTDLDLTVSTPLELERLIEVLSNRITIKLEGPNLFRIEYRNEFPKIAQRVVDTTLQIFVDMNLGDQQKDMETAQRFIDQKISEYETKLRNAELQVAEFRRRNSEQLGGAARLQRYLERVEQELQTLQSNLQSSTWQRDQLRVQLSRTPKFTENTTAAAGSPRANLEALLGQQRAELARLQSQFTERHPDVLAQNNLVARTEADMKSAPGASVNRLQTANGTWDQLNTALRQAELVINSSETRIEQQKRLIDDLARRVSEKPEAEAELIHITRDHEVLLRQYERLIERRESARMAQRMGAEADNVEFRIIEPPVEPAEPSGPPRVLMMAGVLFVGFGIGGGIALLRILMLDAFTSAKQLADAIGLPVIGTLSLARAPDSGPKRIVEATMATVVAAFLLGSFGGLTYLYTANPTPPAFKTVVESVTNSVLQRFGRSI
jgi:polysaccharide chain length determinant protein (PEP-CTERM system associated)